MKNLILLIFCTFLSFFTAVLGNSLVAQDSTIFFDDFEAGQFKSEWKLHPNISGASGLIQIWDNIGINGSRGVAIGKSSDGGLTTNALDLHLDLSDYEQVALTFFIKDVDDNTHLLDGIYFSDDNGLNFKKVLDFLPDLWCDQYGQFPPLDVDQLAIDYNLSLNDQFVIRFQQQGADDFAWPGYDGFFLDNVNVYEEVIVFAKPDFCDDFETGALDSKWAWRFANQTSNISNPAVKPSGTVGVFPGIGHYSEHAVQMGKWCDDGFSANALDLHLDLSGLEGKDVKMTFVIMDINDETHNDDGIYFSDDGGENFTKVFAFKPGNWCDQYGQFPPFDIRELANKYGLDLTERFIIRFQQYDDEDFWWPGQAGFYIDNVCIYTVTVKYETIPYFENFETGIFGDEWSWSWADSTVSIVTGETRPSNTVHVSQGNGHNSEFAAALGKWCDDGFAGNALDLHLNFAGWKNLVMTYDIMHNNESTHQDDGIYFSDDQGKNFKKVIGFDFNNMQADVYHPNQVINIDQLAGTAGLGLTDGFVIRFQQFGNEDFWWPGEDGIFLDNINIQGDIINPSTESQIEDELKIYPNPTSSALYLNFDKTPAAFTTLKISDAWGRLHLDMDLDKGLNTHEIDVSTLTNGVYLLKLEGESGSVFKRFVKVGR